MSSTGTRRATAADVARSLGISRATVGFVLNDTPGQTISGATRDRVLAEAERLGYRPNVAAQALARGRSDLVLLLLPDWPLDFALRRNLEEAETVLDEAGYTVATQVRHRSGRARPLWESLQPDVVVGLTPFTAAERASILRCGVRHIVPAAPDPDTTPRLAWFERGPELQVAHLHDRGHRVLGFAASSDPRLAELQASRLTTAQTTAHDLGLPDLLPHPVDHAPDAAVRALRSWQEAGVSAVVGYNDDTAAAALAAALRSGLRVPDDLAVVGHDDSPLASLLVPALTSIRIDTGGTGRYLARLVLHTVQGDPLDDPPDLRAELVQREST